MKRNGRNGRRDKPRKASRSHKPRRKVKPVRLRPLLPSPQVQDCLSLLASIARSTATPEEQPIILRHYEASIPVEFPEWTRLVFMEDGHGGRKYYRRTLSGKFTEVAIPRMDGQVI